MEVDGLRECLENLTTFGGRVGSPVRLFMMGKRKELGQGDRWMWGYINDDGGTGNLYHSFVMRL